MNTENGSLAVNRRSFAKKSTIGIGVTVLPSYLALGREDAEGNKPPSQRVNVALIGSGGWIAQHAYEGMEKAGTAKVVAFCDVDQRRCAGNLKKWRNNEPFFEDFRILLEKMEKDIDAVVVSTPDHTHFSATMAAMERGIHVYTQKPLTHNIWQARTLRKAKHRYKVITQMGNQGHANSGTRRAVEVYRAGLIGDVREVIAGNDGPRYGTVHWVFPKTMPPSAQPVPKELNYDLWLGPVAKRPFSDLYLPQKWRSFYDFGCGVLGDFGCHTLDVPVWAMELENPTSVEAVRRPESADGVVPKLSTIEYQFAATKKRGPVTLTWYSGKANGNEWPIIKKYGFNRHFGPKGAVMVGSKGLVQTGSHGGEPRVYPVEVREAMKEKPPRQLFPRVEQDNSFKEWLDAITGDGPEPGSNFDYASNLAEIALLGALAERFNTRIEWDGERGLITNHSELNFFVKEPARQGWTYGEEL